MEQKTKKAEQKKRKKEKNTPPASDKVLTTQGEIFCECGVPLGL